MVLQRVAHNLATKQQQQESTRPGALADEERFLLTEQSYLHFTDERMKAQRGC